MALLRTRLFTARMSPAEMRMLHEIAEAEGISAADFVRLAVRRAYTKRFGQLLQEPAPAGKPAKARGGR